MNYLGAHTRYSELLKVVHMVCWMSYAPLKWAINVTFIERFCRTLEKYKFMPGLKKLKRKAKITWNAEKAPCI